MNEYITKDSGERQQYDSGMVRDSEAGKIDYSRVFDGPMFERWAALLTRGAQKYPNDPKTDQPNWMKACGLQELMRARRSTIRHFVQAMRGDTDEDHQAAVFFGLNLQEYIKERMVENAQYRDQTKEQAPSEPVVDVEHRISLEEKLAKKRREANHPFGVFT